ncbi:MFS transporter [Candidatus Formimonas warabiya]|uniref:MFS transporter n=1 Tax=Formimonas warabiya TaxID=1761012 RepID=UPI001BE45F3C|nr:MFS transporter [Candidatus Formimonas warabiya]
MFNVSVSTFMATLDGSIVNIALPIISQELNVTISAIQWVVTSYLLTISVLLLVWGKLSDIYGKKNIFAFGFIIFTVGSALCGISDHLQLLVFSRVLQAVGASAMMALSQGIVTRVFPPGERGKALGITGTTVAIGSLVGPSLGGILVHMVGWQSIFFINVPIGLVGTVLTFAIIPELHDAPENRGFDIKGTFLFSAAILLLFLGLLFLQERKVSVPLFISLLLLSATALILFFILEERISNPLINLNLFHIHEFSFGLGSAFLSFVAISATLLFMPFYLQYVLKLDPLSAGLIISFYPVTAAVVAPFSGWLSDKVTYRPLTVTGLAINTIVLFGLATLNSSSSHITIILLMALLGGGVSIFQSPNNSSVMGAVPKDQLGVAGGMNALFRNLGMVSGTTLSVLIFSLTTKMDINLLSQRGILAVTDTFLKGYQLVLIFAALSCLFSVALSFTRFVRTRPV